MLLPLVVTDFTEVHATYDGTTANHIQVAEEPVLVWENYSRWELTGPLADIRVVSRLVQPSAAIP